MGLIKGGAFKAFVSRHFYENFNITFIKNMESCKKLNSYFFRFQ